MPKVINGVKLIAITVSKIITPLICMVIKLQIYKTISRYCKQLVQNPLKRKIQTPLPCGIAVVLYSAVVFAGGVKEDAELFARSALIQGQEIHKSTKVEDIPSYTTDNPEEVKYYSSSDASLEKDSIAKKESYEDSSLIEDSYNKKIAFKEDANKVMNVSKNIENNPQNVIESLTSEYSGCEEGTSSDKTGSAMYQTKRCDEYITTEDKCSIGNIITLNSNTNYICTKEKEFYKKTVTRTLNQEDCSNGMKIIQNTFQTTGTQGNNIILSSTGSGTEYGCGVIFPLWKFTVEKPIDISTFQINNITYNGIINVYLNNIRIYTNNPSGTFGFNVCTGTNPSKTVNQAINLLPYILYDNQENTLQVVVISGGSFSGKLNMTLITNSSHSCNNQEQQWNEDIQRNTQNYNPNQEEQCITMQEDECKEYDNNQCIKKQTTQNCTQNNYTDYCKTISKVPACNKLESKCTLKDNDTNECIKTEEKYTCGDLQYFQENGNTVKLESPYSLVYGGVGSNLNQCTKNDDTSHCDIISSITEEKSCYLGSNISECTEYQNNNECTLKDTKCFDDNCSHKEKLFQCMVENSNNNSTTLMCSNQKYCLDETCAESTSYEKGNSLPKVLTYLKALEETAEDSEKSDINDIKIFTGSGNKCEKDILGARNCCKGSGWGSSVGLGSCSYEEENLGLQREKGQCVYVGSYCSEKEKLTGICLKKAESYCCFNSKLSRIIQEQGKAQIGLDFGNAESPNCRGLTVEEMQSLDFEKIDFTEYTSELTLDMKEVSKNDVESKVLSEIGGYDGE